MTRLGGPLITCASSAPFRLQYLTCSGELEEEDVLAALAAKESKDKVKEKEGGKPAKATRLTMVGVRQWCQPVGQGVMTTMQCSACFVPHMIASPQLQIIACAAWQQIAGSRGQPKLSKCCHVPPVHVVAGGVCLQVRAP
jgi:hypothetical protein